MWSILLIRCHAFREIIPGVIFSWCPKRYNPVCVCVCVCVPRLVT